MLPYPSGSLHMGHMLVYTIGDVVTRFRRRTGMRVLHPMGWDAFGLPAENNAIKEGVHPRASTERNIESIRASMKRAGWSYDWTRELSTHDPDYYRWQQWQFLRFLEQGLAYRKGAPVKWCPNDQTVLANEQVLPDGTCERCGALVESRVMEQWFFRITDYADALLDDLDTVDWPESIKARQRNWIGRSHGSEIEFRIDEWGEDVTVFTTRPDTLFGATFFVLAPEHELVARIESEEVQAYVRHASAKKTEERAAAVEKTGVFTGLHAVNPVNGEAIPVYVADYVLTDYGTGAIMAVPAHDQRDYDFAQAFDLPVRQVIAAGRRRRGRACRTSPTPRATCSSTPASSTGCPRRRAAAASSRSSRRRGAAASPSTTACATGASRASATGAARSRSSTARRTASCPCRTTSSPSSCRRSRTTSRRASLRSRRRRTGCGRRARGAGARRAARPRRWTPSSTRRGTSSATATRTTTARRSTGRSSTTGTRSTSTSAASTTRRCT